MKIAINGFTNESRRLLYIAMQEGVRVDCFVDGNPQYRGLRYLNKPIAAPPELAGGDLLLLPCQGSSSTVPADLPLGVRTGHINAERGFAAGAALVVVGENPWREAALIDLKAAGFSVSAVVKIPTGGETRYGGGYSPQIIERELAELAQEFPQALVVIASRYRLELAEQLRRHGYGHQWQHLDIVMNGMYRLIESSAATETYVLWGGNRWELELWRRRLSWLGISVAYGVLDRLDGDRRMDVDAMPLPLRDKAAVLGEDRTTTKVLFVGKDKESFRAFMHEHRLPCNMCVNVRRVDTNLDLTYRLDPLLGYILTKDDAEMPGLAVLRSFEGAPGAKPLRVALLGDSVTDVYCWASKTVPEFLVDIAREHGRDLELYSAAINAHNSTQSLLRLLRDVLPLKPDVVLGLSTPAAEAGNTVPESSFVHPKQRALFKELSRTHGRPLHEPPPQPQESALGHWLTMQRAAHGVCAEFGIPYRAFVQAWGRPLNDRRDLEWYMHGKGVWWESLLPPIGTVGDTEQLAPLVAAAQERDWLIDATSWLAREAGVYLDAMHFTERGARVFAEQVYAAALAGV